MHPDGQVEILNELEQLSKNNIKVRGYVSCVLGCPIEGIIPLENVLHVSKSLLELGYVYFIVFN